jgi:hypothetical protein
MSLEQTKFYNMIKVEQDTTLDLPEDDATPADVYEGSHGRCTTLYQDPQTQLQEYCQAPTMEWKWTVTSNNLSPVVDTINGNEDDGYQRIKMHDWTK